MDKCYTNVYQKVSLILIVVVLMFCQQSLFARQDIELSGDYFDMSIEQLMNISIYSITYYSPSKDTWIDVDTETIPAETIVSKKRDFNAASRSVIILLLDLR